MNILLIEDDPKTADFIKRGLMKEGYALTHTQSGGDGYVLASTAEGNKNSGRNQESHSFDLLIVDRMLPVMDGISLVKKLRADSVLTPVLLLSALGEVDDRVAGLDAGGDDYLTKPFAMSELVARVSALLRRQSQEAHQSSLSLADLHVDLLTREVRRNEEKIDLQPREFRLLEYLLRNSNQVVTRTMLLENVWDYHFDPQTNVIDVHVSRLRAKIDKPFDTPLLHTVRGAGYILRE